MIEARPLLPTDVIAFVPYGGQNLRNEAWTRDRLGADESVRTLGMMLDQLFAFARGRNTWIITRRGRLLGLVGVRQRGSRQAWEVDYLVDATTDHGATARLLESAVAEVGRRGAEKLFLRLNQGSDLLVAAREAGFMPYQEEVLYARGYSRDPAAPPESLRPVVPSDSYLLFRLYNEALPEVARRSEAATFGEWHASQDRRWLRNGVQLLAESEGSVKAWVRAARLPQGVVEEITLSETALDSARGLIAAAAHALDAGGAPLFVVIPSSADALARRLEEAGFGRRQEFICLVRRTVGPVALPRLSPAVAKNAVGV